MGTVRNAQYGRRRDLYGSNVRTPVSPREMAYEKLRSGEEREGVGRGVEGVGPGHQGL